MSVRSSILAVVGLVLCVVVVRPLAAAEPPRDWRHTALQSSTPSDEVVHLDIDGDGRMDLLERWWNGRRVRWLDENGDLLPTDTRGDQVGDVMQIDANGDGLYDGLGDQNIKWADNDGDGQADVQAFAIRKLGPQDRGEGPHWMLFIDADKDGVLGWQDWQKFDFDCWAFTGRGSWLPDYNGDSDFLKIHADPDVIDDLSLNWENPFSFYDTDGDGVSEMAIRWLDPHRTENGVTRLSGVLNEANATLDLDNDAAKDNETDFDISFRVYGGPGIPYRDFRHPQPQLAGQPRFDAFFASNAWRRVSSVSYMPRDKGWDYLFTAGWGRRYMVFDEDDDDHRWERVELYYPTHGRRSGDDDVDIYSTKRWRRENWVRDWMVEGETEQPGLNGNPQSDSVGDRGEFDHDDSGRGQLYVGIFDRKLHLAGAEWGAWTVDREGRFHGGWRTPNKADTAKAVSEVVRYADTDGNGFLDSIEYDYEGDRRIDLKVSLLDYKSEELPHPDVTPLIDTQAAGWSGLSEAFLRAANDSWREALAVYRAAWRRGLTTAEVDRLANSGSAAERYQNAYWIKETIFRTLRARLHETGGPDSPPAASRAALEARIIRAYYLGRFDEYVEAIAEVPGR